MNPCRTSLLSFLGGLSIYFGILVGFLVLEKSLNVAWLVPGTMLLVGGFLLGLGLCRELRSTVKHNEHKSLAKRTLPLSHDCSYAMSLASRSSHYPRPR
jgi:uncharacterized membrane protein HdeD (DUF308 family)